MLLCMSHLIDLLLLFSLPVSLMFVSTLLLWRFNTNCKLFVNKFDKQRLISKTKGLLIEPQCNKDA